MDFLIQILGGLVGALIVETNEINWAALPSDVTDLYEDAKVMVISHWYFGTGGILDTYNEICDELFADGNTHLDCTYTSNDMWFATANGQHNPSFTVESKRAQLLRIGKSHHLFSEPVFLFCVKITT
jgi:hypothetical protein